MLQQIIEQYKANIVQVSKDELYKWRAVKWFQDHWDINAADFPAMLSASLDKSANLLSAGMYFARKMIELFAGMEPETVRTMFRELYDEAVPLQQRIQSFTNGADKLLEKEKLRTPEKTLNHYQNMQSISVYLTFEYPEKYYIYKARVFEAAAKILGYTDDNAGRRPIDKFISYTRMCNGLLIQIQQDKELQRMSKERLTAECYPDDGYRMLTQDIVFYTRYVNTDSIQTPLDAEDNEPVLDDYDPEPANTEDASMNVDLNTILYGPPGTGKTWHTTLYAVAIIENKNIEVIAEEAANNYDAVAARYRAYKERGFIEFTTFHQSYGYEEFIEGIKPVMVEAEDEKTELAYQVVPGSFKKFCDRAILPVSASGDENYGINDDPTIWKVSLEGTYDNPTRRECLDNGHIRIGWDNYGPDITEQTDFSLHGGKNVLSAFWHDMQIGDIVLSCYNASEIDAVGVVTGEPEWHDEYSEYKRLRKVRWLAKDIRYNIVEMNNGRKMTLSTVYRMNVTLADVMEILAATHKDGQKKDMRAGNYVFIIDEINRGNISKIFGELITLIETDKRLGRPEAMTVRLPYQEKPFGVPDNVYLLGTMNTADRSIALIDTALRRRFQFVEMQPDPSVLDGVTVEGCDIGAMLATMNRRIEVLYDREHTIGHAYFVRLKQSPTLDTLASIFENCILPLLAEYFFEDYSKIRLVLGDNQKKDEEQQFVLETSVDNDELFGKGGSDLIDGDEEFTYRWNKEALHNIEAYMGI